MRNQRVLVGLFGLAWALGLFGIWWAPALPFQDLIAHAGFLATRLRYASSPVEQSVLDLAPELGPYSLFHASTTLASHWLAPLAVMRLEMSLVWTAYPLALCYARWRLIGRPSLALAFVGLLLSLGWMTMLGLVSFQLGAALLVIGNAEWLVFSRTPSRARAAWIALWPPLLFFAHGFCFVLFMLLVASSWTRQRAPRVLLPLAPGVAVVLLVLARHGLPTQLPALRFELLDKTTLWLTPTLLTRFGVDVGVGLVLWAGALLSARAAWRATGPRATLARQAAALGVAFLLLPHAFGPLGFVDGRLLPTLLALALIAFDEAHETRAARVVAAGTFAVLGCALIALLQFQREARGSAPILAQIPSGARLLHLPLDPDSRVFAAHPFLHYDKLALIERPLIVSDVWFHAATALSPKPSHPSLRLPTRRYAVLGAIRWNDYRLTEWDYVLCRTRPDAEEPADVPAQLRRIDHEGGFWLYRVEKAE